MGYQIDSGNYLNGDEYFHRNGHMNRKNQSLDRILAADWFKGNGNGNGDGKDKEKGMGTSEEN